MTRRDRITKLTWGFVKAEPVDEVFIRLHLRKDLFLIRSES